MKNIIPFKKDIIFKTNLDEITSISLEHNISIKDNKMKGDFIISGEYKVSSKSSTVEPFEVKLPFEIMIDERYDSSKATIDIDDFYYEVVNNSVLSVSIDLLLDRLEENKLEVKEEVIISELVTDEVRNEIKKEGSLDLQNENKEEIIDIEEERKEEEREIIDDSTVDEKRSNIFFNNFSKDGENYVSYNIYILRDGDSVDMILDKYNCSEEELKKYNDIANLKVGDKVIVPSINETD